MISKALCLWALLSVALGGVVHSNAFTNVLNRLTATGEGNVDPLLKLSIYEAVSLAKERVLQENGAVGMAFTQVLYTAQDYTTRAGCRITWTLTNPPEPEWKQDGSVLHEIYHCVNEYIYRSDFVNTFNGVPNGVNLPQPEFGNIRNGYYSLSNEGARQRARCPANRSLNSKLVKEWQRREALVAGTPHLTDEQKQVLVNQCRYAMNNVHIETDTVLYQMLYWLNKWGCWTNNACKTSNLYKNLQKRIEFTNAMKLNKTPYKSQNRVCNGECHSTMRDFPYN